MLTSKKTNQADEMKFSSVFYKYTPYWPLLLLFLMLSIGLAYFYVYRTPKKYEASASIMLEDDKKEDKNKETLALDPLAKKNIVENEIEVLKSRTLMDSVVKSLHLYAPIHLKEKYRKKAVYTSAITIQAKDPEDIEEVQSIPIAIDDTKQSVTIDGKKYPTNQWVETPYGTLMFAVNKNKRWTPKGEYVFSLAEPRAAAEKYHGALKVAAATKLAGVVNITLQDEVPKRAEDILNRLIEVYEHSTINEKNVVAQNTREFVEERLKKVSRELDSIERKVQQYKTGTTAIDLSTQGRLFLQNVSENDQKLSEVNIKLSALNQVEQYVATNDGSGKIVPSTFGINDPALSQLLEKLYTSEMEYQKLKSTVGENNPMLVSVTDQINKLRPTIIDNIRSQKQGLIGARNNISGNNSSYNNMLQTLPQKERQLLDISRDQSIKSGIYAYLLQKREESAIAGASNFSHMKIIDKAQATLSPVSPNGKMIYGFSIAAAVLALFVVVGIREGFSLKLLFRKDIESLTSIPVIGEIGYEKKQKALVVEEGKRTFISEEFRRMRVALPYIGVGGSRKKILVTSNIPGEGKSFIALNLAQTLALTEKKVVLIDLDLNNSSLAETLQMKSKTGATQVLTGDNHASDVAVKTDFNDNLFFIAPGTLPSNPSELLSNGKIKGFLNELEKEFDYIVIDSAPVVPVSDAYIISGYCDTTIFVVRHNYTPKILLERLDENMKLHPLVNPAILFNGVTKRGLVQSNYGYGYGYNYLTDYLSKPQKNKALLNGS